MTRLVHTHLVRNGAMGAGGILGPFADYRSTLTESFASADVADVAGGAGAGLFEFCGAVAKPSGGTANLNWLLPSNLARLVKAGRFLEDGAGNPHLIASANGGGTDTAASITAKWTKAVSGGTGDIVDDGGDIKWEIRGGDFFTSLTIPWALSVGGPNPVLFLWQMKGTYRPDSRNAAGGVLTFRDDFKDISLSCSVTAGGAVNRVGYSFSTGAVVAEAGNFNSTGDFAPLAMTLPAKFQNGNKFPGPIPLADGSTPDNLAIVHELGEGPRVWLGPPYCQQSTVRLDDIVTAPVALDQVILSVATQGLAPMQGLKEMWLRRYAAIELTPPP